MGTAIEDCRKEHKKNAGTMADCARWYAVTADGMTGHIVEFESDALKELKQQIKQYRINETARMARLYEGL